MSTTAMPECVLCSADVETLRSQVASWPRLRPQDVDDIVSDTLLAVTNRSKVEPIRNPRRWLLKAAKRNVQNCVRRRYRQRTQCLVEVAEPSYRESSEDACVDIVWEAFDELPVQHQRIIYLCVLCELSIADAAREFGIAWNTAESRLTSALESLRRDPRLIVLLERNLSHKRPNVSLRFGHFVRRLQKMLDGRFCVGDKPRSAPRPMTGICHDGLLHLL